ncbi:hypothetical protein DQ04_19721000 [Trypanosoma grayi]|uniref:hypothetical protein n=1 Tax=Trypanosoma grayi TaxID=71804 RepID=UPI0004F4934C|nr:hypothetical protein DQ04_19721000 [Trypanosoma grayi]KEG05645.1 hypothetical protein DQ04_19721000 [Trypanosoma grayi]
MPDHSRASSPGAVASAAAGGGGGVASHISAATSDGANSSNASRRSGGCSQSNSFTGTRAGAAGAVSTRRRFSSPSLPFPFWGHWRCRISSSSLSGEGIHFASTASRLYESKSAKSSCRRSYLLEIGTSLATCSRASVSSLAVMAWATALAFGTSTSSAVADWLDIAEITIGVASPAAQDVTTGASPTPHGITSSASVDTDSDAASALASSETGNPAGSCNSPAPVMSLPSSSRWYCRCRARNSSSSSTSRSRAHCTFAFTFSGLCLS